MNSGTLGVQTAVQTAVFICSNVNQRGAQAAASGGFAASLRDRSCENTTVTKTDNQVQQPTWLPASELGYPDNQVGPW